MAATASFTMWDLIQSTTQEWGGAIFLYAIAPLYLLHQLSQGTSSRLQGKDYLKIALNVALACICCLEMSKEIPDLCDAVTVELGENFSSSTVAKCTALVSILIVMAFERKQGLAFNLPSAVFWGVATVACGFYLGQTISAKYDDVQSKDFLLIVFAGAVTSAQFVLSCFAPKPEVARESTIAEEEDPHPEVQSSLLGSIFMSWMTSYIWNCYKHGLKEDDPPEITKVDRCDYLCPRLDGAIQKEKDIALDGIDDTESSSDQEADVKTKNNVFDKAFRTVQTESGSDDEENEIDAKGKACRHVLLKALLKTFGLRYSLAQFLITGVEVSHILSALLMESVIRFIQNRDTESEWKGYGLAMTVFLMYILTESGRHRAYSLIHRMNKRIKVCLKSTVFKKALLARNESKKYLTNGELSTLISDDCEKIVNPLGAGHIVFTCPIQLVWGLTILYTEVGWGAFAGFAIMAIACPLNVKIGKMLKKHDLEKTDLKDKRIKLMNEILNGINVLKLYAWENSFKKKIVDIRNEELVKFQKNGLIFACIHFFFCTIPYLVSIVVYYIFISQGGYFDPAKAYLTVALFDNMNGTFTFLPLHMPSFYQGWLSLKKVNKFLNISEIPEDVVTVDSSAPVAVSIKNGEFTWDTKSSRNGLQNINMDIPDGGLVAVVGRVGSGKSSLLSAVLGEMEKVKGNVTVNGSIAYVPQEAWILNATFEDNILFQSEKNSKKYNRVVDACALRTDLDLQKRGDQTLIGERGVNLSGGQKQRVSTARAVYSDADIYLLDDPLSAVDAHVGKHIFHSVIGHNGLLQGKTRILVTHGVHWLPFVDHIIVMKEGRISETGTFRQLLSYEGDLARYLKEVFDRKDIPAADNGVNLIREKIFRRLSSLNEEEKQEDVSSEDEGQLMGGAKEGTDTCDGTEPLLVELEAEKTVSTDSNSDKTNVDDEEENEESVEPNRRVYIDYIKSMGVGYFILCFSLVCGDYLSEKCKNWAMSEWGDDPYLANRSLVETPEYAEINIGHFKKYALLGLSEMVISFFFVVLFFRRGVEAARDHHDSLLTNILRSPMSFFDTTPTGRIINRFSKDVSAVDNLPHYFRGYLHLIVQVASNFVMVIALNPRVIPMLLAISAVYFSILRVSVEYLRPIKRLQKKSTSPLYTHISETLNGTDSIRAYKAQGRVIHKMQHCLEKVMRYELTEAWVHDWTNIRWSLLSALMTLTALISLMWNRDVSPGQATVLLACITGVIRSMGHFVVFSAYVDAEMVSLERVIDYSKKPTEAAWELPEANPHPDWPLDGSIELEDYKTRYRKGLDLVLKGITCKISSGEKVGIVGRTGAGKSSLTVALFRLIESAGGRILVNGEAIAPLGLHDLRNKITILPQSPVIFGGTLRMNLDPLGVRTSEDLWDALKHSHLQEFVEGLPQKLEYDCGEGGKNLSTGQRQLICLARALLRKTNILVLDEATAGVDMETDDLIQKTIREEFKDCTVLTIAHRLNTVMDYDKIMVLESGTIKEFDPPKKLLADHTSEFYSMAKDAKIVT